MEEDPYTLGRGHQESLRYASQTIIYSVGSQTIQIQAKIIATSLNYQLQLFALRYGWTIPPTIPIKHDSKWDIADVATGTG